MHVLVLFGVALSIVAHFSYIKDTVRGDTKPNRVSWLMWSIAPLIASGAALTNGVRWAAIPTLGEALISLAVFFASFVNPRAYWKLRSFDYVCGTLSCVALVMWLAMREPNLAIIFSIASDALATMPTIVKSWKSPESESGFVYIGALAATLTSFAGVQSGLFSEYAFPVFLVISNSALIFAVYRHRFFKGHICVAVREKNK